MPDTLTAPPPTTSPRTAPAIPSSTPKVEAPPAPIPKPDKKEVNPKPAIIDEKNIFDEIEERLGGDVEKKPEPKDEPAEEASSEEKPAEDAAKAEKDAKTIKTGQDKERMRDIRKQFESEL